jgi:SAM-dependent methyltransferase
MMLGNRAKLSDYLDLFLLRLAKLGRKKLDGRLESEDFYDSFFTDTDDAVFNSGLDRRKTYKGMILDRFVRRYVGEGGMVLDVGCGVGDNLKQVKRGNVRFAGLEYSPRSLERATKALPDDVQLRLGSAVKIPFPADCADMVMCIEVLEHIPDEHEALREIFRVLKSDGHLILSVPYRRWFPSYYTCMGHIRHYTRSGLEMLLAEKGFAVVEWLPNYPRWHRAANYCYVACRVLAIAARVLRIRTLPHELRFPLSNRRILDSLFDRIERIKTAEEKLDYAAVETSTFVLCRKCG